MGVPAFRSSPEVRTCRAFACFVLQIPSLVRSAPDQPDAVRAAFDLLEEG